MFLRTYGEVCGDLPRFGSSCIDLLLYCTLYLVSRSQTLFFLLYGGRKDKGSGEHSQRRVEVI